MRRFFRIVLDVLAMMAVALVATLVTMRFAIHGFEVEVPNLTGLTLSEASDRTQSKRLNLNLENSFYSTTVPAGRVLAQSPAPGTKVRKLWNVRVTESLGPQQVAIPNVVGQQEREATINIRHLALDLGTVSYLPGRGSTTPDIVLAQSPPPNAAGVDRPRVSILLSQIDTPQPAEFVRPDLVRMSYAQAVLLLSNAGLHVAGANSIAAKPAAAPVAAEPVTSGIDASQPPAAVAGVTNTVAPGTVVAQFPAAGHLVTTTDNIRLSVLR
jgi:beta-lactam-binding protein with PASTA domain